jgi:hypothetical protein
MIPLLSGANNRTTGSAPDAPTEAVVMEGYGNDTSVVNVSNLEYVTVRVTVPAGTESIDTIEATLSDGTESVIGTAPGGEEIVYIILDATALADGALTLSARAYNARGSSSSFSGTAATKDATPPALTVTQPADDTVVERAVVLVAGTCSDTNLASLTVDGQEVPVAAGAFETAIYLQSGQWGATIEIEAADDYGNVTVETRYIEVAGLEVAITSHDDGDVVGTGTVTVSGTIAGPQDVEVMVNGTLAQRTGGTFTLANVPLAEGENTLTARAATAQTESEHTITLTSDTIGPVITVYWPDDGDVTKETTIEVVGEVEDATLDTVTVNSVEATLYGNVFIVEELSLTANQSNTITIVATDGAGNTHQDQLSVTCDTTAPTVEITSPGDESTVSGVILTVTGTVDADVETVDVNGMAATVEGTSWSATVYLGTEGEHTVTAKAVDEAGNEGTDSITVTRDLAPRLRVTKIEWWSPQSTDEVLAIIVYGVVSENAGVYATNSRLPGYPPILGVTEDLEFEIPRVLVVPGENIITVTAAQPSGLTSSVDFVVEVDADEAYELPGQTGGSEEGAEPADQLILTVEPATTTEDDIEVVGLQNMHDPPGGEPVFFSQLAKTTGGEGETAVARDLELKAYSSTRVWQATDLLFKVELSTCNRVLVNATLEFSSESGLKVFEIPSKKRKAIAQRGFATVIIEAWAGPTANGEWKLQPPFSDPSYTGGVFWKVDAMSAANWRAWASGLTRGPDKHDFYDTKEVGPSSDVDGETVAVVDVEAELVDSADHNMKDMGVATDGWHRFSIDAHIADYDDPPRFKVRPILSSGEPEGEQENPLTVNWVSTAYTTADPNGGFVISPETLGESKEGDWYFGKEGKGLSLGKIDNQRQVWAWGNAPNDSDTPEGENARKGGAGPCANPVVLSTTTESYAKAKFLNEGTYGGPLVWEKPPQVPITTYPHDFDPWLEGVEAEMRAFHLIKGSEEKKKNLDEALRDMAGVGKKLGYVVKKYEDAEARMRQMDGFGPGKLPGSAGGNVIGLAADITLLFEQVSSQEEHRTKASLDALTKIETLAKTIRKTICSLAERKSFSRVPFWLRGEPGKGVIVELKPVLSKMKTHKQGADRVRDSAKDTIEVTLHPKTGYAWLDVEIGNIGEFRLAAKYNVANDADEVWSVVTITTEGLTRREASSMADSVYALLTKPKDQILGELKLIRTSISAVRKVISAAARFMGPKYPATKTAATTLYAAELAAQGIESALAGERVFYEELEKWKEGIKAAYPE